MQIEVQVDADNLGDLRSHTSSADSMSRWLLLESGCRKSCDTNAEQPTYLSSIS